MTLENNNLIPELNAVTNHMLNIDNTMYFTS